MRKKRFAFVLSLLLFGSDRIVRAQCTYPSLVSGTAVTASTSPAHHQFNQTQRFWTAIAVRPAPGEDWNLGIYQATDVAPNCVASPLASSAGAAGVDLVVGDFNVGHDPLGSYYPSLVRVSGSTDAQLEWDDGASVLLVNAPLLERVTGPTDVVEIWDAQLNSGVTYTLAFSPAGAALKLLVFRSGPGAYWAGRASALVETGETITFVPPATGFYGIAVVNDDGAAGTYRLGVGRCETPTELTAGTALTTTSAEKYYSFTQSSTFWSAVGARGASDWNVDVYGAASGSPWPTCFGEPRAGSSVAPPGVDFVVGNFNSLLVGTHFARVHLNAGQGSGTATVEWDDGPDFIAVDGPEIAGTTGPTDVLQVWDVYLEEHTTYFFTLNPTGSAMKLFLFSPSLLTSWGGRADAALQMSGSPNAVSFTPDSTEWHGLVVTNEDGGAGTYTLRIASSLVAVDDVPAPFVTGLQGVVPNPGRGPMNFRFSLHEPSAVSFDVLDVAGRLVAETVARDWPAGRWALGWDGTSRAGARLGAGVYFVRMRVGPRVVARQKMVLLD